jgi:hypothetical protein
VAECAAIAGKNEFPGGGRAFGHDFGRLQLHAVSPREDDDLKKKGDAVAGGDCALGMTVPHELRGDVLPLETAHFLHGEPTPIPAGDNSIVCHGGDLIVQNNNSGPDSTCTQQHESSHIGDWKGRYGNILCQGVADGSLPTGGPGYDEFLRTSECRAYRIGKACRVALLATATDADKPAIQTGINRDDAQLAGHHCN